MFPEGLLQALIIQVLCNNPDIIYDNIAVFTLPSRILKIVILYLPRCTREDETVNLSLLDLGFLYNGGPANGTG